MRANKDAMRHLVKGAEGNKSEMIRRLVGAGYRQADVARFLDIRDQFVSNVVRQQKRQEKDVGKDPERQATVSMSSLREHLKFDSEGRLTVPATFRKAMEVGEGGEVFARVVDGELRISTSDVALRRAQEMVRKMIPSNESLVDSLIADRREEAAREERGE
ncbi:MAG: hypothetical protein U1E67_21175 [Hyphomicrobiales bacterium]